MPWVSPKPCSSRTLRQFIWCCKHLQPARLTLTCQIKSPDSKLNIPGSAYLTLVLITLYACWHSFVFIIAQCNGFWPVEFPNCCLGASHLCSDAMLGLVLLSAPVSSADLVTHRLHANKHPPLATSPHSAPSAPLTPPPAKSILLHSSSSSIPFTPCAA